MASSQGDPHQTAKWAFILTVTGTLLYFGIVYAFILGPNLADPEAAEPLGAGAEGAAPPGTTVGTSLEGARHD